MVLHQLPDSSVADGIEADRLFRPVRPGFINPTTLLSPFNAAAENLSRGYRNRFACQEFVDGIPGVHPGRSFGWFFHVIDPAAIAQDPFVIKNKNMWRCHR